MDSTRGISTPLEAAACVLETHQLPSYLTPALEYVSQRLTAKGLHVTLVVARRDYQLPSLAAKSHSRVSAPTMIPVTNLLPSPPMTPSSPEDAVCAPSLISLKSLVVRSKRSSRSLAATRHLAPEPSLVQGSGSSHGVARKPRRTATAPSRGGPKTPATPASGITSSSSSSSSSSSTGTSTILSQAASSSSVPATASLSLEQQGPPIRFIHTTPLPAQAYKLLASTLARASRKFGLATRLTAHAPSTFSIPPLVLHSSILQNETLHASEGLTVLSLDHLYTFKAALGQYAVCRTEPGSPFRLEDAVDELRRYVLLSCVGGKRRLLKSTLTSAYDWLGPVNETALGEVMTMYARAYGNASTETGVEDDLVQVNDGPALAASVALAKIVDGPSADDNVKKTPKPLARPQPQPIARLSAMTIRSVAPPSLPLLASPPATPRSATAEIHTVVVAASSPGSVYSQQLLSPTSAQNWVLENHSPLADKEVEIIEQSKSKDVCLMIDRRPLPALPASCAPSIPSSKFTATKSLRKASPPALKLQTSFPGPPLRKSITQRKKTPIADKAAPLQRASVALPSLAAPPVLSLARDIPIEIAIPESDIGDDDDDDDAANLTDFEDADLTARSPVKTPGGSLWLCIDDILSSYEKPRSPFQQHRRKGSSCLYEPQWTPLREKVGPMTPNAYEDISPITRGEWGFLMVSDQFRTRTATVTCV